MAMRRASRRAPAGGAWPTVAVVAGGLFLAVLSTTVVSVALPTIASRLHAGATDLQWVVDAYVLVYSSLLVAGGVLGDRDGRKGVFLIGVAAFGLGSLLTGLAPSVGPLLAGRVVQGLGPALLVLLAARLVPRIAPGPARGRFDWPGAALTTTALGGLALGTIEGQELGWTSPPVVAAFAAGVAALAGFVAWERRAADPLVDVRLSCGPGSPRRTWRRW
jgi:MFS transporter, DHA2 family, methylenomycin A resistance protein